MDKLSGLGGVKKLKNSEIYCFLWRIINNDEMKFEEYLNIFKEKKGDFSHLKDKIDGDLLKVFFKKKTLKNWFFKGKIQYSEA